MLNQFLKFLDLNKLADKQSKILLAVSGGVDSVVMAHLFHHAGYHCAIAHCNFQLRGQESDDDEKFVEKLAAALQFKFHKKKFNTLQFSEDNSFSIQVAARHLRYEWFRELAEQFEYGAIATAHHANDVAETMLINLVRGTGLAGMHGIPVRNGKVIRPLLFAERHEIENYATVNKLSWRNDSSNEEENYTRNKIRNKILPLLYEINPRVVESMNKHAALMRDYEQLTHDYFAEIERRLVIDHFDGLIKTIYFKNLLSYPAPQFLLYNFIGKYGFNDTVCDEILNTARTGAEFLSHPYKIYRDRDSIVLVDFLAVADTKIYTLNESERKVKLNPGMVEWEKLTLKNSDHWEDLEDFRKMETVYLDVRKLKFPLQLRRWEKGDFFHPIGMKGRKLISDFLTDEKIPAAEKELVYLLLSENEVVWIVGYRPDERFRLESDSKEVFKFKYSLTTLKNGK